MSTLVCFLGLSDYKSVVYQHLDQLANSTPYVQVALVELLHPDNVTVLVTPQAEQKHGEKLRNALKDVGLDESKQHYPQIPVANSAPDLWKLLELLSDSLADNEEVIFDITHSFRSQPLLIMLAAVYLRVVKKITIKGIYYGAFEAKNPPSKLDETKPTDVAPIFDLTPFVQLLDLTSATAQFLDTGSSTQLSNMLKSLSPEKALADDIKQISQSFELLRPQELMTSADRLAASIAKEKEAILKELPPVAPLLNQIEVEYGKFSMNESDIKNSPEAFLRKQYDMIRWYREKNQLVHCVATAKEWVTTLLCVRYGADATDFEKGRKPIDALPSGGTYKTKTGETLTSEFLEKWNADALRPQINTLLTGMQSIKLGGETLNLNQLRNDLMHVGFSKNSITVADTEKRVDAILKEIDLLAKAEGIIPSSE